MRNLELENEQLKALVLDQQIELKKQFKRSQSISPPRKVFRLNEFLSVQCRDALPWPAFVSTFGVGLESSDITLRIAHIIIDAAKALGVHRRALHCLDAKRKKMCIKLNAEWVQDDYLVESTIQESMLQLQSSLLQKTKDWQHEHPNWADRDNETMHFVEMVQRVSAPVDFSKLNSLIMASVTLPKC
jgi:hypothetical protein